MKGMGAVMKSLRMARKLLEDVTPLARDCGQMCGCACCLPDEDGQGGVWLLPGEAETLQGAPWARILPGDTPLLMCEGQCERSLRPFLCRLFPLIGVRRQGAWQVRMDRRARSMCPLTRGGASALDPAFTQAARQAVGLLGADPVYAPLLRRWAQIEREAFSIDLLEAGHGAD